MRRLRNGLLILLCVPFYLLAVVCIVLSKYLYNEEIDTGPPQHIRH